MSHLHSEGCRVVRVPPSYCRTNGMQCFIMDILRELGIAACAAPTDRLSLLEGLVEERFVQLRCFVRIGPGIRGSV